MHLSLVQIPQPHRSPELAILGFSPEHRARKSLWAQLGVALKWKQQNILHRVELQSVRIMLPHHYTHSMLKKCKTNCICENEPVCSYSFELSYTLWLLSGLTFPIIWSYIFQICLMVILRNSLYLKVYLHTWGGRVDHTWLAQDLLVAPHSGISPGVLGIEPRLPNKKHVPTCCTSSPFICILYIHLSYIVSIPKYGSLKTVQQVPILFYSWVPVFLFVINILDRPYNHRSLLKFWTILYKARLYLNDCWFCSEVFLRNHCHSVANWNSLFLKISRTPVLIFLNQQHNFRFNWSSINSVTYFHIVCWKLGKSTVLVLSGPVLRVLFW